MKLFLHLIALITSIHVLSSEPGSSLNERTYKEAYSTSPFESQNSLNSTKNNRTLTGTLKIDLNTKEEETLPKANQPETNEVDNNTVSTDSANQTTLRENDSLCSYLCCCCVNAGTTKNSSPVQSYNSSQTKKFAKKTLLLMV